MRRVDGGSSFSEIPKLHDHNYTSWKISMRLALTEKDPKKHAFLTNALENYEFDPRTEQQLREAYKNLVPQNESLKRVSGKELSRAANVLA